MPTCAVATCKSTNRNTKGTGIRFFKFPKNQELAKQWIVACRREDANKWQHATICSLHFEEKFIEIPLRNKLLEYIPKNLRTLKTDAVPTLNLPREQPAINKIRKRRVAKWNGHEEVEMLTNDKTACEISVKSENHDEPELDVKDEFALWRIKGESEVILLKKRIEELERKNTELEIQNTELVKEVNCQDSKIRQYEEAMAKIFTSGPVQELLEAGMRK